MKLVVDASVAVKWFFRHRDNEPDIDLAPVLLDSVTGARNRLLQPPHFVAEMMAVLARETPESAERDLRDLLKLSITTSADAAVYARAVRLAIDLDHHLFDTLYHALALESADATFVTADRRYLRKARGLPRLCALTDAGGLSGVR